MKTTNRCEAEVDAIRESLYKKVCGMTPSEHTRWSNERTAKLASQYGFKIGKPSKKAFKPTDTLKQLY